MPQPRFLLCESAEGASALMWRLLAGNNHLLGRSPVLYDDEDGCREAVGALVSEVESAVSVAVPGSGPGRWAWQLVVPGPDGARTVVARSGRSYERQRESRSSLENFLAAVPVAAVAATVTTRPQGRRPNAHRPNNANQPRTGKPVGAGSPLPPE